MRGRLRLITPLPAGRGLSPGELETMVRECPFGRVFRDEEGDLLFIGDFVVAGTTVRWFLMALDVWTRMRQRAIQMLRLTLAPPAPRTPGPGGGEAEEDEDCTEDLDDDGDDDEPRQGRAGRTVVH